MKNVEYKVIKLSAGHLVNAYVNKGAAILKNILMGYVLFTVNPTIFYIVSFLMLCELLSEKLMVKEEQEEIEKVVKSIKEKIDEQGN